MWRLTLAAMLGDASPLAALDSYAREAPVLFTGWSRAAMAQRDQDWMTALVDWALAGGPTGTLFGAETLRQLARRADPARCARETTARPAAEIPLPIRDAISVLRFRYDMLKELEP